MTTTRRLFVLLTVLALVGAACGDDDDAATTIAAPTVTAAPTTAAGQEDTTTTEGAEDTTTTEGAEDTTTTEGAAPGRITDTEELVVAVLGEPQGMRGELAYVEANVVGLRNVYESLTYFAPEGNELSPLLATDWEQVEPTRWRFYLQEGVSFHDGSAFDAESAAFNIDWVWGTDNAFVIRGAMGPQITAEVVDEYTVDVVTPEPDPLIPKRMALFGMQSMEQIMADPDDANVRAVGTGPYRFVEWEPGQHYIFEEYPDWWGLSAEDPMGTVIFRRLRFEIRPEGSVREAMAEAGEAEIAMFISPEGCEAAESDPDRQCIRGISDFTYFGRIDMGDGAHPALSDPRVRQAIILAIDHEGIRELIMGAGADPEGQLFGPGVMGYAPLDPYPYDPDRAIELLDEARADGVDVDGLRLHVAARVGTFPRSLEIVEAMGAMLEAVGIPNDVAFEDVSVFNTWITTKPTNDRASLMVHPINSPLFDYGITLNAFATCDFILSVYCNPEFDEALAVANASLGDERQQRLADLVEITHDEFVFIPIALVERVYSVPADLEWRYAVDQRVRAVQMTLTGG